MTKKKVDENSITDELRRCFNVSSVDELEKMTKDQCLSILRGAKSANFQKTDYYRQTILVYLQEKVIFTNNDWSKKKITIYADSSHTKESCETMAAFIFRLDPAKKGFVRREEGIDHLSQVWGNKWIFPIAWHNGVSSYTVRNVDMNFNFAYTFGKFVQWESSLFL